MEGFGQNLSKHPPPTGGLLGTSNFFFVIVISAVLPKLFTEFSQFMWKFKVQIWPLLKNGKGKG